MTIPTSAPGLAVAWPGFEDSDNNSHLGGRMSARIKKKQRWFVQVEV
jgi:hypothetical protein